MPQKNPKIPIKGNKKFLFDIFKEIIWNKMCSLFYLKAKNEEMKWRNEETRKNILFTIF